MQEAEDLKPEPNTGTYLERSIAKDPYPVEEDVDVLEVSGEFAGVPSVKLSEDEEVGE